jgi:hypothetical protein
MEAKDRSESEANKNSICRLEWIAWAIDAARRHKEGDHSASLAEEEPEPAGEE